MNKNWIRWLNASIYNVWNNFNRVDTTLNVESDGTPGKIPMYFGYVDSKTKNRHNYSFELRKTGQQIKMMPDSVYQFTLTIGIICYSLNEQRDLYAPDLVTGIASTMFVKFFEVLKYGSRTGDDQSYVACMKIIDDNGQAIRVWDLGLSEDKLYRQVCVEATYLGNYKD